MAWLAIAVWLVAVVAATRTAYSVGYRNGERAERQRATERTETIVHPRSRLRRPPRRSTMHSPTHPFHAHPGVCRHGYSFGYRMLGPDGPSEYVPCPDCELEKAEAP